MRRFGFRHAFALVAIGAGGFVAAPALSTSPYLPRAVDFEQSLGPLPEVQGGEAKHRARAPHLHPGAGPVSYRSAPIAAPRRFDLVGIAGEMRPVELRTREADGAWSDWVEAANGDPAYAGGADEVQLRARGWRPRGTLHYVNVSGTADATSSALTDARTAINGAFVAAASVFSPAAEAAPGRPPLITRSDWGANRSSGGCKPRTQPATGQVKAGVVHHTVTTNSYGRGEVKGIVLGICRYHRNANGWNDIGYNALVDRFGRVIEGRDGDLGKAIVGAHSQGFNAQTTGVASIGTHSSAKASQATKRGLTHFLSWKLPQHGIDATGKARMVSAGGSASRYPAGERVRKNRVIGHRGVGHTECPGGRLNRYVDDLRRRTQKRIERHP